METSKYIGVPLIEKGPYSLGKLIEWKPNEIKYPTIRHKTSPYSLGKLIEWKLALHIIEAPDNACPYSLGKLIEWKLHSPYREEVS